jgi:hypothetical protein
MLVEIFWRNGGGEKKLRTHFSWGVSTRTPTHTQTLLGLGLYNFVIGKWKNKMT